MALNYIWIGFFIIAFFTALFRLIFFKDTTVFQELQDSTFSMAKMGFEISIGLTGVLTLWLGIMKIGEKGGIVNIISRLIGPFFNKLFPQLPKNHPAFSSMVMNIAANMLGLDNAATPMGLKAMKQMQDVNPSKETASDAQIMFLVLNTSGLTLIPISVMIYRAEKGANNPADVFIPILLATFCSTLVGLLSVAIYQRINLFNKVILSYLGGAIGFMSVLVWYFSTLSQNQLQTVASNVSSIILFSIIIGFILLALRKKVNVYEAFLEGAKDGFGIAIKIIPYLIGILVAIGVFRASGAMSFVIDGIGYLVSLLGMDTEFVKGLPTAFMKPLSGSGARGMMVEAMQTYGADSFAGRLSSTLQGTTDTTFYVLAVYFGSVGIKKTRYAVSCGLLADLGGIVAAIAISYWFFG